MKWKQSRDKYSNYLIEGIGMQIILHIPLIVA